LPWGSKRRFDHSVRCENYLAAERREVLRG
jgi:hypothetical protein